MIYSPMGTAFLAAADRAAINSGVQAGGRGRGQRLTEAATFDVNFNPCPQTSAKPATDADLF